MGISGIGASGENPFLKKMQDDISGLGYSAKANPDDNNLTVSAGDNNKIGKTDGINKTDSKEMSAQANMQGGEQKLIDKSQFTDENEIQELDLQEFEDDM